MYKLAIIEDEDFIRKSLVRIIKREITDFEIVDVFDDACEIVDKVCNYNVILTDIKMPRMSGLNLAELIYENKYQTKVILLSAYNEFEYAKQAISFGVLNYLSKPLKIKELKEAFSKVKEVLDEECKTQIKERKDFYVNLALGSISIEDAKTLVKRFEPNLHTTNDEIYICEYVIENYREFLENVWKYDKGNFINALCSFLEYDGEFISRILIHTNNTVFVLVCDKQTNKADSFLKEKVCEIQKILGLILAFNEKIYFKNILHLLKDNTTMSEDKSIAREQGKLLYSFITEKKTELAINVAGKIKNQGKVFDVILQQLKTEGFNTSGIKNDIPYMLWVKSVIELIDKKQDTETIIEKVKDYIYSGYMDNISLEEISHSVYFNQAYLGRIFKEKTGQSFNEFLISVRMKKALDLLLDPKYKVYEISSLVGYKSTQYFYKIFNSYYGMTPTEYRKRRLQ